MEWVSTNFLNNAFACLSVQNGKILNDDCLAILEEILRKLSSEDDSTLHTFRRDLGFGQIIRKSFIPLLLYMKDEKKIADATKIINTTIKILINLTLPVEYLLSIETMSQTDIGRHTIFELNQLLTISKEAFADSRSTKLVVDHIKDILENNAHLDFEQCDSINNCLLLLRNVLHTPETKMLISNYNLSYLSMQNRILWNLFMHGVDKIIIYLISCPQKIFWSVTIVQLIALIYKDQHVGTLQKLLNLWLEASYSDSSDDESNTSPPEAASDDLSSLITSDSTSDLSDHGGNVINKYKISSEKAICAVENPSNVLDFMKKNKCVEIETTMNSGDLSSDKNTNINKNQSQMLVQNLSSKNISSTCIFSQSEISDCGYVTQIENQESLSTSSNDEDHKPVHQKSHATQKDRYCNRKGRVATVLEKKDLRRKRLVKRNTTNRIKPRGAVQHSPTDEDIANIIKEFTVDFLLKGYGALANDLHTQLLTNVHFHMDPSHFFWLITYFFKFATQMELDLEYLGPVLSYEILSYLIFQAVCTYEELEISISIPNIDLKHCLRCLHLVVIAIKDFLHGLETYQKMIHLNDDDLNKLSILQAQIRKTEDFKMLFVLLLRQYNQNIQSKQYLQDLILTNHNFLLFLENGIETEDEQSNMKEHLTQFATVEIMRQYGLLLENFRENGKFVNNCIFAMMHHVCSDPKNISKLFQPSILKTFLQICETDYEICDDWSDLMEYILHKFINTPETYCIDTTNTHLTNFEQYFQEIDQHAASSEGSKKYEYTRKKEIFRKYYEERRHSSDAIAQITEKQGRSETRHKTEHSVILRQNIASASDHSDIMKNDKHIEANEQFPFNKSFKQMLEENGKTDTNLDENDIRTLTKYLLKENKGKLIIWLQKLLVEVCYVKLALNSPEEFKDNNKILEPTVYHCALLNLPIPLIPWAVDYKNILEYQPFLLLLHKLGFQLPNDTGKSFVRIPNFWSADYILSIAQRLGPIDSVAAKFDISNLDRRMKYGQFVEPQNSTETCEPKTDLNQSLYSTPPLIRNGSDPRITLFVYGLLNNSSTENFIFVFRIKEPAAGPSQRGVGNSRTIPNIEETTCHIPPLQLTIADGTVSSIQSPTNMEYYPVHEPHYILIDDIEKNSNFDTASLASELSNMYVSDVSDEEDTMIGISY